MWNVMLRCTIVLMVALALVGCRTGFPNLSGGPQAAPVVLSDAKAAAPDVSSQLQHEQANVMAARAEAERETLTESSAVPRKLLAALPLAYADTTPEGVIGRAVEASLESNRSLVVVGVGAGAERVVFVLAAAMEARGVRVLQEVSAGEAGAPSRVDLYLGA